MAGGGFEVVSDNTGQVVGAISSALERGLEEVGLVAEGAAKGLCPKRTSRLANSITHQVVGGEKAVYVGTNVEYARYVEFREDVHHENGQAHYLRDAATKNVGVYEQIIRSALGG